MILLGVEVNRDSLDFGPSASHAATLDDDGTLVCRGADCFEQRSRPAHRIAFPGCNALCAAQAKLECGLEEDACKGACEKREVPEECWDEDDALLTCQARAVACRDGRVWFPSCLAERDAFDQCQVRAAIAR
jgi:hypothetical protein